MEPRVIITAKLLKSMLDHVPASLLKEILTIYSLPFDEAVERLDYRYQELLVDSEEAASIWIDFKNALSKMSNLERERLREQCVEELKEFK